MPPRRHTHTHARACARTHTHTRLREWPSCAQVSGAHPAQAQETQCTTSTMLRSLFSLHLRPPSTRSIGSHTKIRLWLRQLGSWQSLSPNMTSVNWSVTRAQKYIHTLRSVFVCLLCTHAPQHVVLPAL